MSISAAQVKQLRDRTSAAMMDCKKALQACDGDMEKAADWLRSKGQAKADKKADRQTAEGCIAIHAVAKKISMVEVNCETDFVARDENFKSFCNAVATVASNNNISDIAELMDQPDLNNTSINLDEARQQLIAKIGENIQVRRLVTLSSEHVLGTYVHGGRIGVILELTEGDDELARDLAMHVAASAPQVVAPEDVSDEAIARERAVFVAQAEESGKSPEIIEKMVTGRIKKFLNEVSLIGQSFVKNPELTVETLLKEKSAKVLQFIRFEVGEGICKEESDFAAEVMAQINRG